MWNDLSMAQKSELMKMFIQNGVYDLNTIIKEYDSRHQSGDEATLPNYSQNVFAEGGNIDDDRDDIDNRTGKPRYRRDIHNVNITSSSENNIEGAARDTSTIGPLAFYPPKYYIGKQGNQFEENPNVTYDSWFDEHPEMIDVMTDIVGRYNNRLNNRGQQLPQLNRFYFEKLYNPEDDPIIHEAIERMLQAKWNRDVRTYNDNRTLNLWDTVEKFPVTTVKEPQEYANGGHLYQDAGKLNLYNIATSNEHDPNYTETLINFVPIVSTAYDFYKLGANTHRTRKDWADAGFSLFTDIAGLKIAKGLVSGMKGVKVAKQLKRAREKEVLLWDAINASPMATRGSAKRLEIAEEGLRRAVKTYQDAKMKPIIKSLANGAVAVPTVSVQALGDAQENFERQYQSGGQLGKVTPYGQWQYPHQITTIPSNNITMQGVNYPVVGISDTGDTKVMLPGLDYLYDGNYVTEYPV